MIEFSCCRACDRAGRTLSERAAYHGALAEKWGRRARLLARIAIILAAVTLLLTVARLVWAVTS